MAESNLDEFGYSVAISKNGLRVVIGGRKNDGVTGNINDDRGHVRVYEWNGITWFQLGDDIDGEASGNEFGHSVAISLDGTFVAAGAIKNDGVGGISDRGHVRVYKWNGVNWIQLGNNIDGIASADLFGFSLDMSSDGLTIVSGAIGNDGNDLFNSERGHARVFFWNGTNWIQMGNDINGESANDKSGRAVSISGSGTRLAIGALQNNGFTGHVRVFEWNGINWIQIGNDIDGEAPVDEFGDHLSISENGMRLIIGGARNDGNGIESGHVRIFEWNGIDWIQLGQDIDGNNAGDLSGWSVSVSTDASRVVIGIVNLATRGGAKIYEGFKQPKEPPEIIPNLSKWGLIILGLLLATFGIVAVRNRRLV